MISLVPPSMVLARLRRKPRTDAPVAGVVGAAHAVADAPSISIGDDCSRLLYSAWNSLVIEPSGPGRLPPPRAAAARRLVILLTRPSIASCTSLLRSTASCSH